MKRKARKLELNRETLRTLSGAPLRAAAAGGDAAVRNSDTCKDSEYFSCTYVICPPPPDKTVVAAD